MVLERWMLKKAKFERVTRLSQIFIRRDHHQRISMILAKVTADILMASSFENMNRFAESLRRRFGVSRIIIDNKIIFNGCSIGQDRTGDIAMSMNKYTDKINFNALSRSRQKMQSFLVDATEVSVYRSLSAALAWIGSATLPQSALACSLLQQKFSKLTVSDLCKANNMLIELKTLTPSINFRNPPHQTANAVYNFSYATFNISKSQSFGQTGIINGLVILHRSTDAPMYHPIDLSSTKQRRVSHTPYGDEILACTEADDLGFYLKPATTNMYPSASIRYCLHVDSKGLYDTIAKLHDGRDYRLRQTVQKIRDLFESGKLVSLV